MLFPTLAFAVFFLFVYFTAWSLDRENGRRKLFLLLASWFFYAQWDWRFVALLIASAVLNWAIGALIARTRERGDERTAWMVGLGVAANLLILGFFKYYGFFIEQAGDLLMRFGWERDLPLLQIVLPVGISFFTFQGISYVVDVHRGKTPAAKSLLDVMLLMSFFPHLVAGPIVRASDLLPQFDVVIQNFKTGGAEKLGLGYEELSKINPKLIYCSMTAFGQDGPRGHMTAYDHAIQSTSGMMRTTGTPEVNPIKVGSPVIEMSCWNLAPSVTSTST